jgi:predicted ester cyclase
VGDQGVEVPLMRLYHDVINGGSIEKLDELYTADYVNHAAPFGLDQGLAGLKVLFGEFMIAFPDQHIEADFWFTHDDLVVAHWTLLATHRGEFFGIPATNKPVVMTGIDIERVVGDRIAEHWGGEDMAGLLTQIGAITLPTAA